MGIEEKNEYLTSKTFLTMGGNSFKGKQSIYIAYAMLAYIQKYFRR